MARRNERLYSIWKGIKVRTKNQNHKDYKYCGAKGITICEEWDDSYETFKEWALNNGYADNLTIDRIDNTKGYEPKNCRWTDAYTQANNKSTNHMLTLNGKAQTMTQWARETGMKRETIKDRLKSGWSVERALTTGKTDPGGCNVHLLTYNGKTQSISQWAKETGIKRETISNRINHMGWSAENSLTTPPMKRKK